MLLSILMKCHLTFPHRACVQGNMHPCSLACGITFFRAAHTAVSKSKVICSVAGADTRISRSCLKIFQWSFFFLPHISMNYSGTCLAWSSCFMDTLMVGGWVNGCLHSLKVPSMYQLFAQARNWSCWQLANIKWRRPCTLSSEQKKLSGMDIA